MVWVQPLASPVVKPPRRPLVFCSWREGPDPAGELLVWPGAEGLPDASSGAAPPSPPSLRASA